MGEGHGWLFEPTFNRSIKLRQALDRATPCQGQADPRITSDAGALLPREADQGVLPAQHGPKRPMPTPARLFLPWKAPHRRATLRGVGW
jgi:hypothetical protein